jgi:glycosyltransferase involved in cell wall biosynthesis
VRGDRNGASPPRLLYVVTEDWYFWSHRLAVARAARDAGFEVHVATHVATHEREIEAEGFRLHPTRLRRGWQGPLEEFRALLELTVLYRRIRPALVHQVALKPVLLGGLAALFAGRPPIVNALAGRGYVFSSSTVKARLLRPILRSTLRLLADGGNRRTIVQNADDAAFLIGSRFVAAPRVVLIRGSGVDVSRFSPGPEPPGPVAVALVSRMLWEKGIAEIVEATRLARERRELRTLLVGPVDPDNPGSVTEAQLRAWADSGCIEWTGPIDDIPDLWRRVHIAVLPSYAEGLPRSLLEAAACGRPLIATDVPGCREIVLDGRTGLRVPPRDAKALADALVRLIDDPDLRARLGANARMLVESDFSDDRVTAATLEVYRELLTESKS